MHRHHVIAVQEKITKHSMKDFPVPLDYPFQHIPIDKRQKQVKLPQAIVIQNFLTN